MTIRFTTKFSRT